MCIRSAAPLLLALTFCGCVAFTDPLGRMEALELAQKEYTDAIRWGKLDLALAYVDPELRSTFETLVPAFDEIRISDYEIGNIDGDEMEAKVTVTYRGYSRASLTEKRAQEHQKWKRIKGFANEWHVQSDIGEVVASLLDSSH
jgi:hypothetical protein